MMDGETDSRPRTEPSRLTRSAVRRWRGRLSGLAVGLFCVAFLDYWWQWTHTGSAVFSWTFYYLTEYIDVALTWIGVPEHFAYGNWSYMRLASSRWDLTCTLAESLLLSPALLLAMVVLHVQRFRVVNDGHSRCRVCAYDLRGASLRCPECGASL